MWMNLRRNKQVMRVYDYVNGRDVNLLSWMTIQFFIPKWNLHQFKFALGKTQAMLWQNHNEFTKGANWMTDMNECDVCVW